MGYSEIIENNCEFCSPVSWWPKYAFHYTDVTNAVSILKEGVLYSRSEAADLNLMTNDNASRQVIDMTHSGATSAVRFYFRPLTPTQYHNEGYKHPALRYCHDVNANVPVPVFFLFDLETLLKMPATRFSEKSLAGGGGNLESGEEMFSRLNFSQIYKRGPMSDPELEKKYRHAEIVYPGSFEIDRALKGIVCRNEMERQTLLNLLRKQENKLFHQYKNQIYVDEECFENNGLFISGCWFYGNRVVVRYSNTADKHYYVEHYRDENTRMQVQVDADFEWMESGKLIQRQSCRYFEDYARADHMTFTELQKPRGATALYMRIFFDRKLMCYVCWQLSAAALL